MTGVDREEWRRWLVNVGLSEAEAYVWVEGRLGKEREEIAAALDVDPEVVSEVAQSALDRFREVRAVFLLMLAPQEFWYNPSAYPDLEVRIKEELELQGSGSAE